MSNNQQTNSGKYAGLTNNGNIGAIGDNATGNINGNSKNKKTCRGCLKEVGEDHQNNCLCQQKDGYCEWCEEGSGSRKNCLCQKNSSTKESSTSIRQAQSEQPNQNLLDHLKSERLLVFKMGMSLNLASKKFLNKKLL